MRGQGMAYSVSEIMQDNGVTKSQVTTSSFGEDRPQVVNSAPDFHGSMLNQRVEIIAQCNQKDKGNSVYP